MNLKPKGCSGIDLYPDRAVDVPVEPVVEPLHRRAGKMLINKTCLAVATIAALAFSFRKTTTAEYMPLIEELDDDSSMDSDMVPLIDSADTESEDTKKSGGIFIMPWLNRKRRSVQAGPVFEQLLNPEEYDILDDKPAPKFMAKD